MGSTVGDAGRPVRLRDVAATAGVSVSTASRALSGAGPVSPAAAAAVISASERLGYRPNRLARALRVQATGSMAIALPWIRNPYYTELVESMECCLGRAGYELFVAQTHNDPTEEGRRIQLLIERQADGLLVIPADRLASAAALERAQRSIPVVQIERRVSGLQADYVGVDNAQGIRMVVDHLVEEGCSSIGFVSGAPTSSTGRSRLQAFRAGMRRHPRVAPVEPILDKFTWQSGSRAVQRLHGEGRMPDGIVCGSDLVALGVIRELHSLGYQVPGDVGVTGFDDMVFAELSGPPLTTVHQPTGAIAQAAVDRLVARLQGFAGPPLVREFEPTLRVRRSSVRHAGSPSPAIEGPPVG